jgi:hypothetical protein
MPSPMDYYDYWCLWNRLFGVPAAYAAANASVVERQQVLGGVETPRAEATVWQPMPVSGLSQTAPVRSLFGGL